MTGLETSPLPNFLEHQMEPPQQGSPVSLEGTAGMEADASEADASVQKARRMG